MPQTGDGDDIERSGGRRRLSDLEARLASIEEAIDARIEAGRRPTGAQQRNLASAQEALRAAEEAEQAAEGAARTFDDLSPSEKAQITRGLNEIGYKQPKRAEDLRNELVALPKEDRKAVLDEVKARRPKK
tara:strand:- start:971 stop:1363 length:393 start_codon:yes stop_codon:yes gene_type:complete